MTSGHLFVANGRLESLSVDVVVIPTDAHFRVEPWWREAAGLDDAAGWDRLRPSGWVAGSALPATPDRRRTGADVWFVDAVATDPTGVGLIAARAIRAIAERSGDQLREVAASRGHDLPLVALPVLGTGRGGQALRRGQVIDELLDALAHAADETALDIVLVAAERSDYSALQHRRRALASSHSLIDSTTLESARTVAARASAGGLALFFGAGISIAAGLPSWDGLLSELVVDLGLEELRPQIKRLGPLEQAELLQLSVTVRDGGDAREALGSHVARIIERADPRPSLAHALLAGMRIDQAATTNYDRLYETAVRAARSPDAAGIDVLPWCRTTSGRPWVLKMHGDIGHPGTIVLSRSSFVSYDSRWKPVGALTQSLMMTKHLLVIGASMTDDNLLRFAYEVAELRAAVAADGDASEIGTLVHLSDDEAFSRLWKGRFDVVVPRLGGTNDPSTTTSADDAADRRRSARALTVFLDAVAMYAERNAPHLLDARYATGHEHEELAETLATAARAARTHAAGDDWQRLADVLDEFGARTQRAD